MNPGFFGIMHSREPDQDNDPIRVLLVDDDEDYFILTRALFSDIEGQAYEIDWKTGYTDARAAMQHTPYDVCLIDYQLGEHDGLELLRDARQNDYPVPMIMLTGHGDRRIDLEAMAAGAADYLYKAKTDAALLERSIRYVLDRARMANTLRENEARIAALYHQEQEHSRKLERAYVDLRRAEEMRDDLVHMIIHDLRGPLTAIMANIQMIGKSFDDSLPLSKSSRYFANARSAANRMMWMIDDLLNVGKLEAGELHLTLKPIYLPSFLAEKQEAYLAQVTEEGKTLTIPAPIELPTIMADIEILGRVLDNLLSNALKYTDTGGHITITAEAQDQKLILCVSDDGEGLLPDDQTRIFEKFVQGTTSDTRPSRHGTGLGLAFCRLAILAHGGTITALGEPGCGTTFTLTLPLQQ